MGKIIGSGEEFSGKPLDEIHALSPDSFEAYGIKLGGTTPTLEAPEDAIGAIYGVLKWDDHQEEPELEVQIMLHPDVHVRMWMIEKIHDAIDRLAIATAIEHDDLHTDHQKGSNQ